jgi:hypothetical protein
MVFNAVSNADRLDQIEAVQWPLDRDRIHYGRWLSQFAIKRDVESPGLAIVTDPSLQQRAHQGILKFQECRRHLARAHPQYSDTPELAEMIQNDPAGLEGQAGRDITNLRYDIRLLHAQEREGRMKLGRVCGTPGNSQGLLNLLQSLPDISTGFQ